MDEIKMDVQRMVKRRKDSGFTLIELMIVIAIIGILAVVLVPKMSGVKDSAKSAGVITNAKSVEAYVMVNVSNWSSTTAAASAIYKQFGPEAGADVLKNPYGGTSVISVGDSSVSSVASPSAPGMVTVQVNSPLTAGIVVKGIGKLTTDEVYSTTILP